MKQTYTLTQEEAQEAIGLKGAEAISNFWKSMGDKYSFNAKTVKFESPTSFSAESTEEEVSEEKPLVVAYDYNSFGKEYALVVTGDKEADLFLKIEQWKDQFGGLKIVDENDKSGYAAVNTAISQLRATRGAVEAKRKQLKEKPLELGRAIDGTAKSILEALLPLEETLKAEKERIDAIKEAQKQQKLLEIERKFNERVVVLTANGMTFTGAGYKLNDLIVGTLDIKAMDEKEWNQFVEKLQAIWTEEQQRQITAKQEEEERKRKEDLEKLVANRLEALTNLGFEEISGVNLERKSTSLTPKFESIVVPKEELGNYSNESWFDLITNVNADIKATRDEQLEAKKEIERKELEQKQKEQQLDNQKREQEQLLKNNRTNALNAMGYVFDGTDFVKNERFGLSHKVDASVIELTEPQWKEIFKNVTDASNRIDAQVNEKQKEEAEQAEVKAKEKLEREEQERKAELARQEALKSDKDKMYDFANRIENVTYPETDDEEAKKIIATAIAMLSEIADGVRTKTAKLK